MKNHEASKQVIHLQPKNGSSYVPKSRYLYRCEFNHLEWTNLPPDVAFCVAGGGKCRSRNLDLFDQTEALEPHVEVMETPLVDKPS